MAEQDKSQKLNTFDDFSEFVCQLLSEQVEGNWDQFVGHIREIVDNKYTVNKREMQLDSMFWNMMTTMGDAAAQVTVESVGGAKGLQQIIKDAHERAGQFDRLISESVDNNGMFVYRRKGRDALPNERYLQFPRQQGSLQVLGSGGQGLVVYGKLKSLPFEVLEKFYNLLVARSGVITDPILDSDTEGDAEVMADMDDTPDRTDTAEDVVKGVRSKKDKAAKLRTALLKEWRRIFEQEGYVFDAKRHFGSDVAVKIFPQKPLSTVGGYEKETKFIGWPSPHIMPILAQGTSKNGVSIVIMPYIDMTNTVSPYQISRMFGIRDVVDILIKLSRSLAQVHRAGFVHRDIKPGNILITREKPREDGREVLRPILTDFGLASIPEYTAYSISNTLKGTPRYLPPEQGIDAKRARPQSDMYALALWAYELLCGETYSPPNENLPTLLNRIWGLARGDVYHKPEVPSAHKYNIVANEFKRQKFHGLFAWFHKRTEHKRLTRELEGLEKILARMIITQNATPFIDSCAKLPAYKDILRRKTRLEYADLRGSSDDEGHKDTFISKLVELRYKSMDEVADELERIKQGLAPLTPDYRAQLFSRVRIGRFRHPVIVILAILAAAAIGFAWYTGRIGMIIDFFKRLF